MLYDFAFSSSENMVYLRNPVFAFLLAIGTASAFIPQEPQFATELKETLMKKASETTTLKSSRAEPVPSKVSPRKAAVDVVSNAPKIIPVALRHHASSYKKWGVDNCREEEYWNDSRIHTLGNCGVLGALHAALAPVSTKLIDNVAYEGIDIRKKVSAPTHLASTSLNNQLRWASI
jgi:hypothetical protein